jgi:carbon-monoxide dehydrogenase small subunit
VIVSFTCNGRSRNLEVVADKLLIDALRDDLELTGTKLGCGTGDCGACTVLLGGRPVNSCLVYAIECDGLAVQTVEGIAETPTGRKLIDLFAEHDAVQCGICTPGFVVTCAALVDDADSLPTRAQIQDALAGNLCRCTGYYPIIAAVESAFGATREASA